MQYLERQVINGLARWVDPKDPTKGAMCVEQLYFGPREIRPTPSKRQRLTIGRGEIPGVKFVRPATASRARRPFPRIFGQYLKAVTPIAAPVL